MLRVTLGVLKEPCGAGLELLSCFKRAQTPPHLFLSHGSWLSDEVYNPGTVRFTRLTARGISCKVYCNISYVNVVFLNSLFYMMGFLGGGD